MNFHFAFVPQQNVNVISFPLLHFRCSPNKQMETFLNYLNPFSVYELQATKAPHSNFNMKTQPSFDISNNMQLLVHDTKMFNRRRRAKEGKGKKNEILWQHRSESMNVEESILHLILFCLLGAHECFNENRKYLQLFAVQQVSSAVCTEFGARFYKLQHYSIDFTLYLVKCVRNLCRKIRKWK